MLLRSCGHGAQRAAPLHLPLPWVEASNRNNKEKSKRPDPNFLDRAFSIAPQQFRNAAVVAPRVELRERVALGHGNRANARRCAVEAGRLTKVATAGFAGRHGLRT